MYEVLIQTEGSGSDQMPLLITSQAHMTDTRCSARALLIRGNPDASVSSTTIRISDEDQGGELGDDARKLLGLEAVRWARTLILQGPGQQAAASPKWEIAPEGEKDDLIIAALFRVRMRAEPKIIDPVAREALRDFLFACLCPADHPLILKISRLQHYVMTISATVNHAEA